MLALFLDSWFLFPQFMAKVETAKEDRITMELPTKWDDAPRGAILSALLGKVSLSKAWPVVAACATDSMVPVLDARKLGPRQPQQDVSGSRCRDRLGAGLACVLIPSLIPSSASTYKLPQHLL